MFRQTGKSRNILERSRLYEISTGEDQANGNGARLWEAVKHGINHSKIEPIIFEIGMSLPAIYPLTLFR
jgi:hypothetical protein